MQIELANKIRRGRAVGNEYVVTRRDEGNRSGIIARFNERIKAEAYIAGTTAFAAGRMRVPAHDPAVMQLIRSYDYNQHGAAGAVVILDAWLKGWDTANLAAPVEGM